MLSSLLPSRLFALSLPQFARLQTGHNIQIVDLPSLLLTLINSEIIVIMTPLIYSKLLKWDVAHPLYSACVVYLGLKMEVCIYTYYSFFKFFSTHWTATFGLVIVFYSFIHSFIYFSVDLLQDMEIVMSIIVQEKAVAYSIYM